jgi:hypothetical protein
VSSGIARSPRARITIGGKNLTPLQWSVRLSKHQNADTFFAELSLDEAEGFDEAFWSDTSEIDVTVSATNDVKSEAYQALLTGQIDRPQIMLRQRLVMVKGRDKTAKLIEAKVNEKWLNRTDKEIIEDLAGREGLTVQFDADAAKSGLEYNEDRNEIASLDTSWNIIVALAKKAGCVCFVKGDVLYVQPIDADNGEVFKVDYRKWSEWAQTHSAQSNAVNIALSRDISLGSDVSVKVQSWRHKQGEAISSEIRSKGKGDSAQSKKRLYQFRAPNLTKSQQDRIAKGRMKEILAHEREIDIDLPGDVALTPLRKLRLTGTGTKFDQDYILAEVLHRMDVVGGYQMSVRGHNQDAARAAPEAVQ